MYEYKVFVYARKNDSWDDVGDYATMKTKAVVAAGYEPVSCSITASRSKDEADIISILGRKPKEDANI